MSAGTKPIPASNKTPIPMTAKPGPATVIRRDLGPKTAPQILITSPRTERERVLFPYMTAKRLQIARVIGGLRKTQRHNRQMEDDLREASATIAALQKELARVNQEPQTNDPRANGKDDTIKILREGVAEARLANTRLVEENRALRNRLAGLERKPIATPRRQVLRVRPTMMCVIGMARV